MAAEARPGFSRQAFVHWLLVGITAALLFFASTDRFSDEHTARVVAKFAAWAGGHGWRMNVEAFNVIARKTAHVLEYAVFTVLLFRAIAVSRRPGSKLGWRIAALSLVLASAYAASDEWHQRFVPSRAASVRDVFLDTGGAVVGLCAIGCWGVLRCRAGSPDSAA